MRVFTIISERGNALPLAQRIAGEGHRVQLYINNRDAREIGNGILEKHTTTEQLVSKQSGRVAMQVLQLLCTPTPDCVILDSVAPGFGRVADCFRDRGIPVIGSSEWAERVANDEAFGTQVMTTMGMDTGEEAVGLPITVEAWFNGEEAISVNYTVKDDRLMEGNKGPKADMGNVVWVGSKGSKLYRESLGKLLPLLRKIKYVGPLSVDVTITDKGLAGLKLIPRFNYNAFYVLLEMLKGEVNDMLYGVATGVVKTMGFKSKLGIGITLAVPPFPIPSDKYNVHIGIEGLNKHNLKHFWGYDFCKVQEYFTCGTTGYVGTVTARGDDIQGFSPLRDAKRRAMRTINNLRIEDGMHRLDIGNKVEKYRTQLTKWGWL